MDRSAQCWVHGRCSVTTESVQCRESWQQKRRQVDDTTRAFQAGRRVRAKTQRQEWVLTRVKQGVCVQTVQEAQGAEEGLDLRDAGEQEYAVSRMKKSRMDPSFYLCRGKLKDWVNLSQNNAGFEVTKTRTLPKELGSWIESSPKGCVFSQTVFQYSSKGNMEIPIYNSSLFVHMYLIKETDIVKKHYLSFQ